MIALPWLLLTGCLVGDLDDLDLDGDGAPWSEDCDETNPDIHPDAQEVCDNGVDDNCDGAPTPCFVEGETALDQADVRFAGQEAYARVGRVVSAAGDVNNDGLADFLIGAFSGTPSQGYVSSVALYLGAAEVERTPRATFKAEATKWIDYDSVEPWSERFSAATAGDVNGDGFDDLLIGDTQGGDSETSDSLPDGAGIGPGVVYLVRGASGRELLTGDQQLVDAGASFIGERAADWAGYAVAAAGDVNRDGYADLLIGAPLSGNSGVAYLILGAAGLGAAGEALQLSDADASFSGLGSHSDAGAAVAGVGDVSGDGIDDFLIGTPGASTTPAREGGAHLILGPGLSGGTSSLSSADASYESSQAGDWAGYSVAGAGDVDGDGINDLIIGAPGAFMESGAGAAHLFLGAADIDASSEARILSGADTTFSSKTSGDVVGGSVAGVGDVDSDGHDDLLIGAHLANGGGTSYLVLGAPDGFDGGNTQNLSNVTTQLLGNHENSWAGGAVAGPGDVNGDGLDDLLIGAPQENTEGSRAGAAYLFFVGHW